jgi:hypothetical protein
MTRFRRPAVCPCAFVIAALGAIAMLADSILTLDHPAFRFGLVAFIVGTTAAIVTRTTATNAAIEAARQAGYENGYADGRRVAHPVVVPINRHRVLERDGSTRPTAPRRVPHAEGQ